MGIFNRNTRSGNSPRHGGSPESTALPGLDSDRADIFRRLVAQEFTQQGLAVAIADDHLTGADGRTFGLGNIAAICAGVEPTEWKGLVAAHVSSVLNPLDIAELSTNELLGRLHVRLTEAAQLPDQGFSYARPVAPGLVETLAADLPETIATLTDTDLDGLGAPDHLFRLGRDRLRTLMLEDCEGLTLPPHGPERVTVVLGPEFFTASLALLLPELTDHATNEADQGHGVFVAVPSRSKLFYRVVDGPDSVGSFLKMVSLALDGYRDDPSPISPHVYWVRGTTWHQATTMDVNGVPTITARPELEAEFTRAGWSKFATTTPAEHQHGNAGADVRAESTIEAHPGVALDMAKLST